MNGHNAISIGPTGRVGVRRVGCDEVRCGGMFGLKHGEVGVDGAGRQFGAKTRACMG